MPGKSKEDTWGAKELTDSIKEARSSGKSRHRDKDRDKERDREKPRDKDRDRTRDKEREDRHRDKERDRDKDKERDRIRDKDREKDRHRDKEHDRKRDKDRDRHRDKDKSSEKDRDHERDKDRERRKHREREYSREKDRRDKDTERKRDHEIDSAGKDRRDKDRERRKDRETDSSKEKDRRDKDRERRKERERDSSREKDRRDKDKDRRNDHEKDRSKHRDKESSRDKEKRERSHHGDKKDNSERRTDSGKREQQRDKDHKKREHRSEDGSRESGKSRTKDEDREKRREEKRQREKDRERRKEKESNDSDREKRKHRDRDGSSDRRQREKSEERRHRKESREERDERRRSEHKNGHDERLEREEKKDRKRHEKKLEDYIEDDVGEEIQKVPEQEEQHMENSNEDYGYEDDFEDYDDDFEDDDEDEDDNHPEMTSEIDALRRAMAAENEAMRRSAESHDSRSERSSASNTRPTTSRTGRTFINFVAAKQRQISDQVSQRTRKRGQELMTLIDLDTAGFDLFDMPPVKEYERYIASFGRSNTKQAFFQCNDDNLDRDVQTEEIDRNERWTQHPPTGALAAGGSNTKEENEGLAVERETNSLRFNRFMDKATQLFTVLLDEELANKVGGKLESNKRSIVFSDGYTLMNTGTPILQGRCIKRVVIHPVQTNLIITMHSMPQADEMKLDDKDWKVMEKAGLTNRGLMCVWNVNEPSRPQKILVLKSIPTTCTFSPSKATMAFCGTADGSICVWDLREPSSMHQKCEFGWGHIMVRVPTYSTEAGGSDESHHCRVVAMQPIVSADDAQNATSKSSVNDDSVGFSFQLSSVDEKGTISFWVVIEIDKPDDAGSESDLGLVPGGKIKLIKSSSIQLQIPLRELGPTYQMKVTDMQLLPSNPNHFFVATDAGFIAHGARNTERVSPKYFWIHDGVPVGVKCLDFSPFNLPCFLVANTDGSIQLFSAERGPPLVSWENSTQGMEIVAVSWSRSRPSVFFVMDVTSKVYVWELLENDSGPVKTEQFTRGRLSALALANDHAATGWGVAGRKPEMIITDEMGSLDVHLLNSRFSSASASEMDAFSDLLQQLI